MIKSGDQLILIGGESTVDGSQIKNIEAYDIRTGSISHFDIEHVFFGAACIDLNEYILICGGIDRQRLFQFKSCWRIFDRTNFKFKPRIEKGPDLNNPRSFGSLSRYQSRIVIHGGFGKSITKRKTYWLMFGNARLNNFEELDISDQAAGSSDSKSNDWNEWKKASWNFTLPAKHYSG